MSRQTIIDNSIVMIGRNIYSQPLREYAISPYTDGNYYSDCSSFVIGVLKLGGYDINWTNTYGLLTDPNFHTVPIIQIGNHISNPAGNLKIADIVIWPGHCCMIHHMEGDDVYVIDHGASYPRIQLLYDQETWNSGDIVVRRLTVLDNEEPTDNPKILYKVQSGAFGDRHYAEAHENDLKNKGFDCFISMKNNLYTVQCGAFKNQGSASELAETLRGSGFDAYVWEYNKEEVD